MLFRGGSRFARHRSCPSEHLFNLENGSRKVVQIELRFGQGAGNVLGWNVQVRTIAGRSELLFTGRAAQSECSILIGTATVLTSALAHQVSAATTHIDGTRRSTRQSIINVYVVSDPYLVLNYEGCVIFTVCRTSNFGHLHVRGLKPRTLSSSVTGVGVPSTIRIYMAITSRSVPLIHGPLIPAASMNGERFGPCHPLVASPYPYMMAETI